MQRHALPLAQLLLLHGRLAFATPSSGFVTRRAGQLFLGADLFRFGGTNEYWLGRGEDGPLKRIPSKYDIEDGLRTAAGMGLTVVRSHSLGISTGHSDSFEPALNTFNESALDTADYAISIAEQLGLRLLVPLTNNGCHVSGCRMDFTRWAGLTNHTAFYSHPGVISDFHSYVKRRLEHVNPYTGRAAKDEPAILAWESGNEVRVQGLKPRSLRTACVSDRPSFASLVRMTSLPSSTTTRAAHRQQRGPEIWPPSSSRSIRTISSWTARMASTPTC